MATMPSRSPSELRSRLEAEFRDRVTLLYRSLQITPPYHSVEKAVLALRDTLTALPEPALRATATELASRNALFTQGRQGCERIAQGKNGLLHAVVGRRDLQGTV